MKQVTVRKKCEAGTGCTGEMKSTGSGYANSRESFIDHRCTVCGANGTYLMVFPHSYFEFEEHEKREEWV